MLQLIVAKHQLRLLQCGR